MSRSTPPEESTDGLSEEEREVFESLKDRYQDDEAMQLICDAVLQSSPNEASEEARS